MAKIGFRETRAYVFRVLESRAEYARIGSPREWLPNYPARPASARASREPL